MNWRPTLFLSGFTACLLLMVLNGRHNIVKATMGGSSEEIPDSHLPLVLKKKLFVQRLDASKFLKKQAIRSARSSEEFDDRTHPEKQGYENSTEDWDELDERNRERRGHVYEYDEYYD